MRAFATAEQLAGVVAEVFGTDRRIVTIDRLPNGSKKGVYQLGLDDATTTIVYIWDPAEDYWSDVQDADHADRADTFSHASGLDMFEAAVNRLESVGARGPRLLFADRSRALYPADIAVIEDLRGGTLQALLEKDPDAGREPLAVLAEMLRLMHDYPAPRLGQVFTVDRGLPVNGESGVRVILDRALADVQEAAKRDDRVRAGRSTLTEALQDLASRVTAPPRIGLIHGELGADHVMLADDGAPVLIDVEGLAYFDIEWEHVFVRMRFQEHYAPLRREDLDPDRMRLFQLAMHVSLIAGPLRIGSGDHPQAAWFRDLAALHVREAFAFAAKEAAG
ncbi:phosphotransferase [Catenulispora pinisilvae]|uniref:phosphotransferase n=1 Tax=Catenulispora pinisilvae TaxID=2705253 RepID=UPI0018914000|nr:phosphotransferase [Catenulispora pinisilvae]